jgi:hypothetical protein
MDIQTFAVSQNPPPVQRDLMDINIAPGNGNVSPATARRWCTVLATHCVLSTALAPSALEHELNGLIGRFDRSRGGSVIVPSEYLEVVITRS